MLTSLTFSENDENIPPSNSPLKKKKKIDLTVTLEDDSIETTLFFVISRFSVVGRRNNASTNQNCKIVPSGADIPVICIAPTVPIFLKRTHMAYRMDELFNEEILKVNCASDAVHFRRHRKRLEMMESLKNEKKRDDLHATINQIKLIQSFKAFNSTENILNLKFGNLPLLASGEFITFQFHRFLSSTLFPKKVIVNAFIFGVNSETGNVIFEDLICRYTLGTDKSCVQKIVEYILPKPQSEIDEIYLFLDVSCFQESNEMGLRRKRISFSSSSSSSSTPIRAFGSLRIAKKNTTREFYQSHWNVDYSICGVNILDETTLKSKGLSINKTKLTHQLRQLTNKAGTAHKSEKGHSILVELQNSAGFGHFDKNQVKRGLLEQPKRSCRTPSTNSDEEDKTGEITYDLSNCIKVDCNFVVSKGLIELPKMYNTANRFTSLFDPEKIVAHKSGSRSYICIFCHKTLTSLSLLKFHLVHSYPSFEFKFSESCIGISFDRKKIKASLEKLKAEKTEILIHQNLKTEVVSKRKEKFNAMQVNNFVYSEPKVTTYPGLKRIEMNYEMLGNLMRKNLHEFSDLELEEAEFYSLWNQFVIKAENRITSLSTLFQVLMQFLQKHDKEIQEKGLRMVYMTFIVHLKETKQLTEFEFMEAGTFGTKIEGKWFGRNKLKPPTFIEKE